VFDVIAVMIIQIVGASVVMKVMMRGLLSVW
jgi:hypothetical protein